MEEEKTSVGKKTTEEEKASDGKKAMEEERASAGKRATEEKALVMKRAIAAEEVLNIGEKGRTISRSTTRIRKILLFC